MPKLTVHGLNDLLALVLNRAERIFNSSFCWVLQTAGLGLPKSTCSNAPNGKGRDCRDFLALVRRGSLAPQVVLGKFDRGTSGMILEEQTYGQTNLKIVET